MGTERKQYTSEQKVAILKRHLVDHEPLSDLCEKNGIHVTMFYRWQQILFEKGVSAFAHETPKQGAAERRRIEQLEAKLDRKHEVLSELMEEHVRLKKALGEL
jgi:transposase-like protein